MPGPEPASLDLRLRAAAESVLLLRQRLCLWLEELGATPEEVFEVALAATEAFGNAVEHPQEPSARTIDVRASTDGRTVTITIRDYGGWQSERRRKEGGYGLRLMRKLMDSVEVGPWAQGTAIRMQRHVSA